MKTKALFGLAVFTGLLSSCSSVQKSAQSAHETPTVQFEVTGASVSTPAQIFMVASLPSGEWLVTGGHLQPEPDKEVSRKADVLRVNVKGEIETQPLTSTMLVPRWGHRATSLMDGRVFICGGTAKPECECYIPNKKLFHSAGRLSHPRSGSAHLLLADGRVLIAGGYNKGDASLGKVLKSAEVYDPKTNRVQRVGDMVVARAGHQVLLIGGKVFVLGGLTEESKMVEEFDAQTLSFKPTKLHLPNGLKDFQSYSMNQDRVLLFGGTLPNRNSSDGILDFDGRAQTIGELGVRLSAPREDVSVCGDRVRGKVLIFGGETKGNGRDGEHSGIADLLTLNPLSIEKVSEAIYRDDSQVVELSTGGCLVVSGSKRDGTVDSSVLKISFASPGK